MGDCWNVIGLVERVSPKGEVSWRVSESCEAGHIHGLGPVTRRRARPASMRVFARSDGDKKGERFPAPGV